MLGGAITSCAERGETSASTTGAISQGAQALDADPLSRSTVAINGGGCTGIVVSPRVVLSAAHCYGSAAYPGATGGLISCTVRDRNGALVRAGGCGFVRRANAAGTTLEDVNVREVWVSAVHNPPGTVANPIPHSGSPDAEDLAVVVLDKRLAPGGPGQTTSVAPWLEAQPAEAYFANRPTQFYGWGVNTAITGGCDQLTSRVGLTLTSTLLTSNVPLDADPLTSCVWGSFGCLGGEMFQMRTGTSGFQLVGMPMPGDSGAGLLVRNASNEPRVVGVHRGLHCESLLGAVFTWATVFHPPNRALLQQILVQSDGSFLGEDFPNPGCPSNPSPNDPDCDGVPNVRTTKGQESHDNCPNDFNPDQTDKDGDGIGDACDTCDTRSDGTNSNFESELVAYRTWKGSANAPYPHLTSTMTPAERETALSEQKSFFPGDACETYAIAPQEPGPQGDLKAQLNGGVGGRIAQCGSGPCPTVSSALLSYRPFTAMPGTWPGPTTVGWRRCDCDNPDDGDYCEANMSAGCARQALIYANPFHPKWVRMAVEATNQAGEATRPLAGPPSFIGQVAQTLPPAYDNRWLWWQDITGVQMPTAYAPNLGIATGRLWTFLANSGAGPTATRFSNSTNQGVRAGVYSPLRLDERFMDPSLLAPTVLMRTCKQLDVPCPKCPPTTYFNLVKVISQGQTQTAQVLGVPSSEAPQVDMTAQLSSAASAFIQQQTFETIVTASEPSYRWSADEPSHVFMDKVGNVLAAFRTTPGTGHIELLTPPAASSTPPPEGAAFALAAREHALFAAAAGQLWRFSLETGAWASFPVVLGTPLLNDVRALTVGLDGDLYVLDTDGSKLRVVRVDARGIADTVAEWDKNPAYDQYSLTPGYGGGLVLTSKSGSSHEFLWLWNEGSHLVEVHSQAGSGPIEVGPRALREGLAWSSNDSGLGQITPASQFTRIYSACRRTQVRGRYTPDADERHTDGIAELTRPITLSRPQSLRVTAGDVPQEGNVARVTFALVSGQTVTCDYVADDPMTHALRLSECSDAGSGVVTVSGLTLRVLVAPTAGPGYAEVALEADEIPSSTETRFGGQVSQCE